MENCNHVGIDDGTSSYHVSLGNCDKEGINTLTSSMLYQIQMENFLQWSILILQITVE